MYDSRDYGHGIYLFDAEYVRPCLAGAYLIVHHGRAAFFDTGTNHSLPNALDCLQRVGLTPAAVDYVIASHVHLDHAGGAGAMMRQFPQARLVVHPRGARHLAEPARLVAGVTAVYGADYVAQMYGDILAVPPDRILEASHGTRFDLAGRELLCLDTPGHARHHICVVDPFSKGIFAGDMFGLNYPNMHIAGEPFIFPTTTPTQFDPDATRQTLDMLMECEPEAIYLTHYGRIGDPVKQRKILQCRLDAHQDIALQNRDAGPARQGRIKAALTEFLLAERRAAGCSLSRDSLLAWWEGDLELNAQGLVCWLDSLEEA